MSRLKVIAGADGKQQFTGKRQDGTGLYYFGARFYDAECGRFITADTYTSLPNDERILSNNFSLNEKYNILLQGINNPQSQNRYSYCYNNPINRIDPDGRFTVAAVAVFAVPGVGQIAAITVASVAVAYLAYEGIEAINEEWQEYQEKYDNSKTKDRMRSRDAKKSEKKQVDDALGKNRAKRERASKDLHKDKKGGGNDRNKSYKELKEYGEENGNQRGSGSSE